MQDQSCKEHVPEVSMCDNEMALRATNIPRAKKIHFPNGKTPRRCDLHSNGEKYAVVMVYSIAKLILAWLCERKMIGEARK